MTGTITEIKKKKKKDKERARRESDQAGNPSLPLMITSFTTDTTPPSGYHLENLFDNTADVTAQISGGKYAVTSVTVDHILQATFLKNLVLRIYGTNSEKWYTLIQSAYNAASNGDDFLTLSSDFTENLEFDRPVSITLQGGCSPDFFDITDCTLLNGNLKISNGTVIIENLIIK